MRNFLLLVALFVFTGCELSSSPDTDRLVGGVDLDEVFASPTPGEMTLVETDWASRNTSAQNVVVEQTTPVTIGQVAATVRIVSHTVAGNKHYGAVIAANNLQPASAPMLVYAHGGDGGVSIDEEALAILGLFPELADDFVLVVPSFRDETLRFGGVTWLSEGPASPWDYDVDDAIALVNVALQVEPAADESRIGVLGFSRGGGVGLLMDIRDSRIDGVVDFFGPTDFFDVFVQDVVTEALQGQPRNLPGLDYLNDTFVQPLADGTLSLDDVRVELVRRSAVLWASDIDLLQVHHGTSDTVVPVSQTESLSRAMASIARAAPAYEAFLYEGGVHDPFSLASSLPRARDFLIALRDQ